MSLRDAHPDINFGSLLSSTNMKGIGEHHKRKRISRRAKRRAQNAVHVSGRTHRTLRGRDRAVG